MRTDGGDLGTSDRDMSDRDAEGEDDWDMDGDAAEEAAVVGELVSERATPMDWESMDDVDEAAMAKILAEIQEEERVKKTTRRRIKFLNVEIERLRLAYAEAANKANSWLCLPDEVTKRIFIHAQDYGDVAGPLSRVRDHTRSRFTEIAISHVCRQWRLFSLAYPNLWAKFQYDASQSYRVPLDRFKAYIKRSKPLPLDLWFNFTGFDDDEIDCEDQLELLEAAIKQIKRWKRFTVISDLRTPLVSIPALLECAPVPLLEYFAFAGASENEILKFPRSLEPTIFRDGAPMLKCVILDSSIGQGILPPLSNITTLCLQGELATKINTQGFDCFFFSDFFHVLSLPFLENLTVLGLVCRDIPQRMGTFPMHQLRNLRFSKTGLFPLILPFIIAPMLETLVIKEEVLAPLGHNLPLLTCFACLHSLYLHEVRITSTAAQYLANMTPMLTRLSIVQKNYEESIFVAYLRSGGLFSTWLNLRHLALDLDIGSRIYEIIGFARNHHYRGPDLRVRQHTIDQWKMPPSNAAYVELCQYCEVTAAEPDDLSPDLWQEHWVSSEWVVDDEKEDKTHDKGVEREGNQADDQVGDEEKGEAEGIKHEEDGEEGNVWSQSFSE